MQRLLHSLALLVAIGVVGCDASEPAPPVGALPEEPGLPTTTAASQNVDEVQLAEAAAQLAEAPGARSLLVARNGYLVGEAYTSSSALSTPHGVRSATKSVAAMLTGIAIEQGHLPGVDALVAPLLPEGYALPEGLDDLRVEDLLTMRAGFTWNEGAEFLPWAGSSDPVTYLLDHPAGDAPGDRFLYNSAATHLLGVVLEQATGQSFDAFADEVLLAPMGITTARWVRTRDGRASAGYGLMLRPRDLVKLGILVLDGGRWDGQEVVPEAWVDRMVGPRVALGREYGSLADVDYGYLWWIDRGRRPLAWGWGGQFIYLDRDLHLVVVTTAAWNVGQATANVQEKALLRVIVDSVLPAAR
ncbi:MAG: serine hydrolase [Bacteroidota bacterium]